MDFAQDFEPSFCLTNPLKEWNEIEKCYSTDSSDEGKISHLIRNKWLNGSGILNRTTFIKEI